MKKLHIIVKGKVQGVGYRYFAYINARDMGINGFVRNLQNGDVELVVEGDPEILAKYIDILKSGPHSSKVEKVEVTENDSRDSNNSFKIRY